MRTLVDFFNHGILAFVGRDEPVERLLEFWRGTAEAPGLRVALVVGEAGVGKSRLVEEFSPRVIGEGGVVVHLKLYPGATTSIAPLLSQAIRFSSAGRGILGRDLLGREGESLGDAIMALQRIARVRPTLVVVEDLHLLEGESLREFLSLLEGISDETISLLCLSRPLEGSTRGILERFVVEEIALDALGVEQVAALWFELFGAPGEPEILSALHDATLGNPLAIRSALRAALKSGAIGRDPISGRYRVTIPTNSFIEMLGRNVELISEGMAAHLTEPEKRCAEALACLGEAFAVESATRMHAEAERMIEYLVFKGVLLRSGAPAVALPGPTSAKPILSFTHTLLHRHFVQHARVDVDGLVSTLASGAPLYSVLPFQLIPSAISALTLDTDEIRRAAERAMEVAIALDATPDWRLSAPALHAAESLIAARVDAWSAEDARRMRIEMLGARLVVERRHDHTDEYGALIDELLAETEEPLPDDLASYRVDALRYLSRRIRRVDYERGIEIWHEVDRFLERHPDLRFARAYVDFMQTSAMVAGDGRDDMVEVVEARLRSLLSDPESSEQFRRTALREVAPLILWSFSSKKELEERLKLLGEIEAITEENDYIFLTRKAALLEGIGHVREALAVLDDVIPKLKDRGLARQVTQCSLLRVHIQSWLGMPGPEMEAHANRILAEAPPEVVPQFRLSAIKRFIRAGVLRNETEWVWHMIETYLPKGELIAVDEALILEGENVLERLDEIIGCDQLAPPLQSLAMYVRGDEVDVEEMLSSLEAMFERPVLTRSHLVYTYGAITLLDVMEVERDLETAERLRILATDGLRRCIDWLAAGSHFGYLLPALDRYGSYLEEKELAAWRTRAAEMERRYREERGSAGESGRLKISMLGTVEIASPGGEPQRVRGARLRVIIGLMIADRMLDKPLSFREFCRIAADNEEDPERARKVMNMAVLRLREAIGAEAVLTDETTPRLNLEKIDVDLLQVHDLVYRAMGAMRDGLLMRAAPLLTEALEMSCGKVPFPTLYDSFFEAAREDFETEIRSAAIELSSGLIREGDVASAERILRLSFESMPDDPEIADLLVGVLGKLGKRMEAERIRMRAADA